DSTLFAMPMPETLFSLTLAKSSPAYNYLFRPTITTITSHHQHNVMLPSFNAQLKYILVDPLGFVVRNNMFGVRRKVISEPPEGFSVGIAL
ncbi:MAG: hypothetical protein WCP66_11515, partial [Methylococcales bacterium]